MSGPATKASDLYYHVSNLTADEKFIIIDVQEEGGSHVYAHEIATGKSHRLTNDPRVRAGHASPHPKDPDIVFVTRGNELLRIHVSSGKVDVIGAVPSQLPVGLGQPTVNAANTHVAVGFRRDEKTWEIGRFDLKTGAYSPVIRQGFNMGHVQYHPTQELIFYVWETGGYAPQRSWVVNSDGTGNRPLYYSAKPDQWITPDKEWMTHESWVRKTGAMTMIMDKQGIVLVEPDGKWKVLFHGRYWHAHARGDGKVLVMDDNQGRIWVGNAETGDIRLLVSNYWKTGNKRHSHPAISESGRYVVFNDSHRHEAVSYIDLTTLDLPAWFKP